MKKANNLSRRYRYVYDRGKIRLVYAAFQADPSAWKFYVSTQKIANILYNDGHSSGSLNQVCTAQYGAVIFQSSSAELNKKRARIVAALWRKWMSYEGSLSLKEFVKAQR